MTMNKELMQGSGTHVYLFHTVTLCLKLCLYYQDLKIGEGKYASSSEAV